MSKQRVLILCTGNSARSQMAEGWLRRLAGNRFDVFSAGTKPVGLDPNAVKVMSELGSIAKSGNSLPAKVTTRRRLSSQWRGGCASERPGNRW